MPRKRHIETREVLADPIFNSTLVEKFICSMMWDGKKTRCAEDFLRFDGQDSGERSGDDPLKLFKKAIENVKPVLEVKSRRVGGSTYQVPVEVSPARRTSLAIRWILFSNSRSRGEKSMQEKLAGELMDAANNRGNAIKKKDDTHRMAEANKAFAHYRW